MDFLGK